MPNSVTILRSPQPGLRPVPAPDPPAPTGNPAQDWFERVVRPDRFDPKEVDIASELRKRITEWQSYDGEFIKRAKNDFDFLSGLQWIEEDGYRQDLALEMARKGRSAFTIDLL